VVAAVVDGPLGIIEIGQGRDDVLGVRQVFILGRREAAGGQVTERTEPLGHFG